MRVYSCVSDAGHLISFHSWIPMAAGLTSSAPWFAYKAIILDCAIDWYKSSSTLLWSVCSIWIFLAVTIPTILSPVPLDMRVYCCASDAGHLISFHSWILMAAGLTSSAPRFGYKAVILDCAIDWYKSSSTLLWSVCSIWIFLAVTIPTILSPVPLDMRVYCCVSDVGHLISFHSWIPMAAGLTSSAPWFSYKVAILACCID